MGLATIACAHQLDVQRHTHPNGIVVLTHEDRSIPMITLHIFYRVGSRNERPVITGVSHLFEHMMFNGSAKFAPWPGCPKPAPPTSPHLKPLPKRQSSGGGQPIVEQPSVTSQRTEIRLA